MQGTPLLWLGPVQKVRDEEETGCAAEGMVRRQKWCGGGPEEGGWAVLHPPSISMVTVAWHVHHQ